MLFFILDEIVQYDILKCTLAVLSVVLPLGTTEQGWMDHNLEMECENILIVDYVDLIPKISFFSCIEVGFTEPDQTTHKRWVPPE